MQVRRMTSRFEHDDPGTDAAPIAMCPDVATLAGRPSPGYPSDAGLEEGRHRYAGGGRPPAPAGAQVPAVTARRSASDSRISVAKSCCAGSLIQRPKAV